MASQPLGDIASVVRGISFPNDAKSLVPRDGHVACLRTTNVQREVEWGNLWFVPTQHVKRLEQFVQPGDILISTANSYELVGKVALVSTVPTQATLGAFISLIRPRPGVDPRFLYHQLAWGRTQSRIQETASTTTNISNVSTKKLAALKLDVLPLDEQRRIVAEIEKQFSRLDEAVANLKRVKANLRRQRAAILGAAVAGTLVGEVRRADWIETRVGEVGQVISGLTKNPKRETLPRKLPYLRVANVYANELRLDQIEYIGVAEHELDKLLVQQGDLLVVEGNGSPDQIGRVALWDGSIENCVHQNHLIKVRWESNAFQFFQRVVQRLSADLKIPFQLDRALYRKDDTIVHEALREAVVNALIHADYRGQGGIVIERYADRIELSNPGSLLVSREQLLRGSVSECRNKGLQIMFQMIGGGEKAGSGMDKIRAGWRSQHWRSPKIEETLQPDRVRLVLPMVSLIPPEVDAELGERFGERFAALDATAVQAVVTARVEGVVTNGRMQEITGEHPKDITGVLQGLVRDGFLEQQKQRRWASYRLAGDSPPISPHSAADSPHSAADSPQSAPDSPHSGDDSRQTEVAVPTHLRELLPLAEPARSTRRLPPHQMRAVIERLCQGRWLAASEIAQLVSRDAEKLQSRFLTAMVREGRLQLRYPDVPNRPDQAYRAPSAAS